MIDAHVDRKVSQDWQNDSGCAFCRIIHGELPSTRVFEDDKVIAFLDILPLRPGHTLVVPKLHCSRLSELPLEYAAAVGQAVSKVANALTHAMQNTALNVVCNQEYAQAVPHVHYHIIPAPSFDASKQQRKEFEKSKERDRRVPVTRREMHQREFESRSELDEDEGHDLATKIRARL